MTEQQTWWCTSGYMNYTRVRVEMCLNAMRVTFIKWNGMVLFLIEFSYRSEGIQECCGLVAECWYVGWLENSGEYIIKDRREGRRKMGMVMGWGWTEKYFQLCIVLWAAESGCVGLCTSSCKDVSIICAVVEVQCLNSAEQFDEVDNNASPHGVYCGLYSMQMWEEWASCK